MDDPLSFADRSLRLLQELVDVDRLEIARVLQDVPVRLHIPSSDLARGAAAQATGATLTNVLVRSGMTVVLDLPEVAAVTPLLAGGSLADALVALGESVNPGAVVNGATGDADLVVAIADPSGARARRRLVVGTHERDCSFGAQVARWSPADQTVAVGAGLLASGEIVRDALRMLAPRGSWAKAALEPVLQATFTTPRLPAGRIDLGRVDVVSAGAVSDALIWTIRARGSVFATGRVFDDGCYDRTNLNRYLTLDRGSAEREEPKGHRLAANAPAGMVLEVVERRFGELDIAGAAPTIIVGADDVAVRYIAQRANPQWLGIGATSHFEVRVTEHGPDEPCAGCAHPHLGQVPDAPIPTIAPVSGWAGFVLALRLLRWASSRTFERAVAYQTFYPLTRPGIAEIGRAPWHPSCPIDERHRRRAMDLRGL
ncbi:MAG: hypothetical protein ACRDGI_05980 [Candidatus Limnocylindrales bacterium]